MYQGEVQIFQEELDDFLNVAQKLKIQGLISDQESEEVSNQFVPIPQQKTNTKTNRVMERIGVKNEEKDVGIYVNSAVSNISELAHNQIGIFLCNQCENEFTSKLGLQRHIQTKHEGIKFKCNHCDYQATQQCALKTHIESKHEGIKYECNQCDNQFSFKSVLTKHIKNVHEGIKYACNQCDQKFTQQSTLKVHIQSIHEGIKYACDQCNQQFTQKSKLSLHRKSQHN